MSHRVFVLLGSNSDPEKNLAACLALLGEQCDVLAVSPVYESAAVGADHSTETNRNTRADSNTRADRDTPLQTYLNAAVLVETSLTPADLKTLILAPIEEKLGRQRGQDQPVTIDLDIMLWDDGAFEYGDKPWRVPHPDVTRYIHAARPLADLAPEYVHPEDGRTLGEIAAGLAGEGLLLREDVAFF